MGLKRGGKGEEVKQLQQKLTNLGYLNDKIDGIFGQKTEAAVKAFQDECNLKVSGIVDEPTLAALGLDNTAIVTFEEVHGRAKEMNWWTSDIQKIFSIGTIATITDVDTGISWQEIRKAGKNHADIQPCTKEDTAKLKKVYGGKWSWKRRAVFVTINGVNYAASIHGMPHGGSSVKGNGFPGHHCCHFTASRTHGSNRVDENHQKMIKKAAAAIL